MTPGYILVALSVSVVVTAAAMAAARRFGIVDHPHSDYLTHVVPTPLLGGIGIVAGTLAGTLIDIPRPALWSIAGYAILLGLGAYKDVTRRDVVPVMQLLLQATACSLGIIPATSAQEHAVIAVVAGVALVNAMNFLDVMDGLCASVTVIIAAGLYWISPSVQAIALASAALGFLFWNRPPARIFMGDIGSFFIGYTLYLLSLAAFDAGTSVSALACLLALPFIELTQTVLRRAAAGRSMLKGDTSHLCLTLKQAGMSVGQVLMCFTGASVLLALAAACI